jgi:hypothetical protein
MLKYAGWDGIVIEGRADEPVWIDIRDENVQIRDCAALSLWGTDRWECQQRIWSHVAEGRSYGDWFRPGGRDGGQTTQRPAVLAKVGRPIIWPGAFQGDNPARAPTARSAARSSPARLSAGVHRSGG